MPRDPLLDTVVVADVVVVADAVGVVVADAVAVVDAVVAVDVVLYDALEPLHSITLRRYGPLTQYLS